MNRAVYRSCKRALVASSFLALFTVLLVPIHHAYAQTPCYTYSPTSGSTVTVDLKTTTGESRSISVANQNPPSILQEIDFRAASGYCAEALLGLYPNGSRTLGVAFVTGTGTTIPFYGSPFPILPATPCTPDVCPYLWDDYETYAGLSDIGLGHNSTATEVSDEDAIIQSIGSTGKFSIKVSNTYTGLSATLSTPATNCALISGNGPRKIVFMRGDGGNMSVSDFLWHVEDIINYGFKSIDPFKTYQNQFSFYADLKKINQSSLPTATETIGGVSIKEYSPAADSAIISQSSCGSYVSGATEYIFLFSDPTINIDAGWPGMNGVVYLNLYPNLTLSYGTGEPLTVNFSTFLTADPNTNNTPPQNNLPRTAIHETAHEIANLSDEYNHNGTQNGSAYGPTGGVLENCVIDPTLFKSPIDGKYYGSTGEIGCNGYHGRDASTPYYRPSHTSIMNGDNTDSTITVYPQINEFNIISCGYIVSAIKGETLTQANAARHWGTTDADGVTPGCSSPLMNTNKDISNSANTTVITVGGLFTGSNNKIYDWVDNNFTIPNNLLPTVKVPPGLHSVGYNTNLLRDDINQALKEGNQVLVIGHSLGSLIAYNVVKQYQGEPVIGIYVDPPYDTPIFSLFLKVILPGFTGTINRAVGGGIATDPNSVIWTNGQGITHFHAHDAFDYPCDYGGCPNGVNARHLSALARTLKEALDLLEVSTAPPSSGPVPTPLTSAPALNGLSANGVANGPLAPGQTLSISGSGFDPSGNEVLIYSTTDPYLYYTFFGVIPSGNSLNVTLPDSPDIPSDTFAGTYNVIVSGVNSDWSNGLPLTVAASALPPPHLSGVPASATAGDTITVTGSGFSTQTNKVGLTFSSPSSYHYVPDTTASIFDAWRSLIEDFFAPLTVHAQTSPSSFDFVVTGVSSADGTSLTFTLPADMPSGTYTLQVLPQDGNWSNSEPMSVIAPISNLNGGDGSGLADTVTASASYSCPNGYTLQSDHTCHGSYDLPSHVSCPSGYLQSGCPVSCCAGSSCVNPTSNTCNTGGTLGGGCDNTCTYHQTVNATVNYSCPTGYTVDSSECSLNKGPVNLSASQNLGLGKASLSWSNNNVQNVASIEVDRAHMASFVAYPDPSTLSFIPVTTSLSPSATTYTDTGLAYNQPYAYVVRMKFLNGNYSSTTNAASILSLAPVPTVSLSALSATVRYGGTPTLTWSSTYAVGCTSSGAWGTGPLAKSGSKTVAAITADSTYSIYCTGTGGTSPVQSATVSVISPPTLTAAASASSVNLAWTDSDSGIAGYKVYETSANGQQLVSAGAKHTPAPQLLTTTASKSYTVTGLKADTSYCFAVEAYTGSSVSSAMSVEACATTVPPNPSIPDVSSLTCVVLPNSGAGNAVYHFSGTPTGGTPPYSYELVIAGLEPISISSVPGNYTLDYASLSANNPELPGALTVSDSSQNTQNVSCHVLQSSPNPRILTSGGNISPGNTTNVLSNIVKEIVNPLIYLLSGVAVLVFLWGLVEFVSSADDAEGREKGRRHLIWGIVGLVIIFGALGILNLIQNILASLFG